MGTLCIVCIMFQAMDLGVPVIARSIAGNKALVTDKENGLLFSDKMVRQLRDKQRLDILAH